MARSVRIPRGSALVAHVAAGPAAAETTPGLAAWARDEGVAPFLRGIEPPDGHRRRCSENRQAEEQRRADPDDRAAQEQRGNQ
jgi:hypothetical protein